MESAKVFFVGKPKATNEVAWKDLNDKEKEQFQIATDKEVHSMIGKHKAIRILSIEESLRVEKGNPLRVRREK